jgi:hypothetical protein
LIHCRGRMERNGIINTSKPSQAKACTNQAIGARTSNRVIDKFGLVANGRCTRLSSLVS